MIIRGGGATGAAGREGVELCIGVTFDGVADAGAAVAVGATGGVARGGTAIAGALVFTFAAAGGAAVGAGAAGVLGGITTTDGGR